VSLNVVFYRDGEDWVAHCVELDLVTAAATREEAWTDIQAVCRAQVLFAAARDPGLESLFRPPSTHLMKMLSLGRDKGEAVLELDGHSVDGSFAAHHDLRIHFVDAECAAA
jgi:hypothetical protein